MPLMQTIITFMQKMKKPSGKDLLSKALARSMYPHLTEDMKYSSK